MYNAINALYNAINHCLIYKSAFSTKLLGLGTSDINIKKIV